jgi:pilus assembly protein CpaD
MIMKNSNLFYGRSTAIALLTLTALSMGGCGTSEFTTASIDTPAPFSGTDSHPITVAKGPVTLEVSSARGTLEQSQINSIAGFAHQAMASGQLPLTISRPTGGGASARVANEIASLVVQQGVPRNKISIATYTGPASGSVNLSYISTAARTKACGQWNEDVTDTSENRNTENHGCAIQANIAAMIANPQTINVPKPKTPIIASTRMAGVAALSSGTSTTP